MLLAAGLTAGGLLVVGLPLGQAVALPFTSFGFVFLAGIMLTEPQTLPGRRAQRYLVAAIVGILLGLPIIVAATGTSLPIAPEVALLVGNIVAFAVGQRRGMRFEVAGLRRLGGEVWGLRLRARAPVRHLPGQAIELAIPHPRPDLRGRLRVLSILSAPGEDELEVAFVVPPQPSSLKRALLGLEEGDRIMGTRVLGDVSLPVDPRIPLLLVAGGIGITPFVSMVRAVAAAAEARDIVVVHRASEPVLRAEFEGVPGVRYVAFTDRRPDAETLRAAVPDLARRHAYVAGPPGMVAALSAMLRRAGAPRIRRDVFAGA